MPINETGAVIDHVWVDQRMPRQRLGAPDIQEPLPDRMEGEVLPKPSPSTATAPSPGPRPDDGQPDGHPAARRPDELAVLPTSGQPHYFSPKPLKSMETDSRFPEPLAQSGPSDVENVEPDASDKRAGFPPTPTAALSDDVPEAMVADPTALGSYHVQVATSTVFGTTVFNKVYPFMAEIDLENDLRTNGTAKGTYWIRYALVDLLGFEQPFSPPRRVEFGIASEQ